MDPGSILALAGLVAAGLGVFWRTSAATKDVQTKADTAIARVDEVCDDLTPRVGRLEIQHATSRSEIRSLASLLSEVRSDVKTLLNRTPPHA